MLHSSVRLLLVAAFFSLSSFSLFGQDQLSGVVMEETDKGKFNPLIGVNVFWSGTTIGTHSDTNGVFTIPDDHKNHKLVISYIGYETDTIEVSEHKEVVIVLKNARMMNEVEVIHRTKATSLSFMDSRHVEVLSEKELFKAACCNLSESFETNASVDASYTDAVSGTRQIMMLGLAGIYTQTLTENLPTNRGLASVYGLTYMPGAWIDNISISKGAGSVVNGYESLTGQINTEVRKPDQGERLYFNAYGNQSGRMEANLDYKIKLNEKWSTSFLLHGKGLSKKNDMNDDGFLDMPLNQTFIGMNRWRFAGVKGIRSQFGLKYVHVNSQGGQLAHDFETDIADQSTWGADIQTERMEAFAKIGYIFPEHKYNSIGLQLWATDHDQKSYYGRRQYEADEQNLYANLIYQTIANNSNHMLKFGMSYVYDDIDEEFDSSAYKRNEQVLGAFFEYTWTINESMTLITGFRADHHNIYDWIYSPRLNYRYGISDKTVLRASAGMGTRVANIFAENSGFMASSRSFVTPVNSANAYGLNPEKAINAGLTLSQNFRLNYRDGGVVVDYFRTEFLDQVIVDVDESPREVHFYNLDNGQSFANSFQIEVFYELFRRFDVKMAYRYYDVKTDFKSGLLEKALLAKDKGFINIAYETKKNKKLGNWKFDATTQLIGRQRLPSTSSNPAEHRFDQYSPAYLLQSAQVTKVFSKAFEVYLGGENLTNYRQDRAIISAQDPYSPYFDASLIWAPIFGTNVYAGLRYKLK